MDEHTTRGKVNSSFTTSTDENVTGESRKNLEPLCDNSKEQFQYTEDDSNPRFDNDDVERVCTVIGTDNPAFSEDSDDNITKTQKNDWKGMEPCCNEHCEEEYSSNSNHHDFCDLEECETDLKQWKAEPEIDERIEVDIKKKIEGIVNGRLHETRKSRSSPFNNAFFLSKYVTMWWMQSLFSSGYRKILQPDDLYDVCPDDSTHSLSEKLEREWNRQAYDEYGMIRENASLVQAILRVFAFDYMLLAIPSVLAEGFRLSQPIFIGLIIKYFSHNSNVDTTHAYLYGLGLTLCTIGVSVNTTPLNFMRQRIGMRLRIATSALVYKKVLRLSNRALSRTTTGHIVNLVSVDAQKLDFAANFLHYLWLSPIIIIITAYLLWREIGVSCLSGVGLLLLLAPLQMAMGRLLMKLRRAIVKYTDQRVKVMNEVITGMRIVKLFTWEESFAKLVDKLRRLEIREVTKLSFLRASFISFFLSSASLVSFITMMTYVLAGNRLTAQKVFTCVSLFNGSRLVMTLFFPMAVTLVNEARVSLERMENLLKMDELEPPDMGKSNLQPKTSICQVSVENLHASWTEVIKTMTLKNISFFAKKGDLVAIVGPVGCGKSSLLMALLGELHAESGTVNTMGRIAYVSQEAWIFNGTLKNNITFGQELDEKKYKRVIEICALQKDLQMLPDGDKTLVGERGVSLSGGQKARVNLARAVYFDADIYILDDPLSAVDAHVGRHLFDQCISGYLSNKLRILVTHQLQYISDADQILVLSEGQCIGKGTYDQLRSSGVNFFSFLHAFDDSTSDLEVRYGENDGRSRRFSGQDGGVDLPKNNLTTTALMESSGVVRERAASMPTLRRRTDSMLSYKDPHAVGSALCLASVSARVKVFEEKPLPKEMKYDGCVTFRSYLKFFQAGYGLVAWLLVIFMFIFCQGVYILADWWLSTWTSKEEKSGRKTYEERDFDLIIYTVLVISLLVLGLSRAYLFFFVILQSSRALHGSMFRATLRAPLRFFDTNSVGRILNRFSKDIGLVDDMFSFVLFDFIQNLLMVFGIVLLVCATNPIVFALVTPIIIVFFVLRWYYIKTVREVKRIEGLNRSPLFGHFSTTLLGLPTIRAFRVQNRFVDFYNRYQDEHTKSWFSFIGSAGWLSFRLEVLSTLFISFVVFISIALRDKLGLSAGEVGLMLAYTINITGVFQQCVRHHTEVENQMTSVERVLEYCDLESEESPGFDAKPPNDWPQRGCVRFEHVSFAYDQGLPKVLSDIDCCINSTEKVGVCGRSGAGKSSLLNTLFRLGEHSGKILIDDRDIMGIELKELRSKISIIPQDPVLFSGTMRKNLDPFENHSDMEIWNALDEVQLREVVEALPGMLESEVAESGNNLSVGQRQLLCLARAFLKRNKILVIDEATANVDPITDGVIQRKIREEFKDCTVLTIAHRLNTIMDSDRIIVLDAGKIKEFDKPYNLLKSKNNLLYKLVAQTGRDEAQKLFEMARTSHFSKNDRSSKKNVCFEEGKADDLDTVSNGITVTISIIPDNVEMTDNCIETTAL